MIINSIIIIVIIIITIIIIIHIHFLLQLLQFNKLSLHITLSVCLSISKVYTYIICMYNLFRYNLCPVNHP